jgi:hypothetical protein
MANRTVPRGLDPEWHGSTPPLCVATDLPTAAESPPALFIGSPVLKTGGYASAMAANATDGSADTAKVTGSIVMLYDASGAPRHNWPANAGGSCEHTFSRDQRYRMTMNNTAYAAADTGMAYGITDEESTAETAGSLSSATMGDHWSSRQLNGATEVAKTGNQKPFWVVGVTPIIFGNSVAVAGTEIWVTINPASWQG